MDTLICMEGSFQVHTSDLKMYQIGSNHELIVDLTFFKTKYFQQLRIKLITIIIWVSIMSRIND